jgi:PTH1 family peptidyl-tRNA hydrolase
MKLIAGLGNPGRKYAGTRHNVGFRVVDELSARWQVDVGRDQFKGLVGTGTWGDERVILLKPMTFMNLSGRSIAEALRFYKLPLAAMIVIVDDLALPLGKLRLRSKGSAGGHNGLSSIIEAVGTQDFARVRVGIDAAGPARAVGHVLGTFSGEEEDVIERATTRAADAVECFVREGIEQAMNKFNRPDES